MANDIKTTLLAELNRKYGSIRKLDRSQSLYEIGEGAARIYIRYSKIHGKNQTFYGLRASDLQQLEGHHSFICFLWDNQTNPLLIPFSDYEDIFQSIRPAGDGQYKAQVYLKDEGSELYIANIGRFNIEGYFGWDNLENSMNVAKLNSMPELSHYQVQTLLGAIGSVKGYDIWVPMSDRFRLDWSLANRFEYRSMLPYGLESVKNILQEVDVIWMEKGSNSIRALFEVEHSTPIYSGLLRFNDIHLTISDIHPRFTIVANDTRRSLFTRQINRPTFLSSGLNESCTFLEYLNVFVWYNRIKSN